MTAFMRSPRSIETRAKLAPRPGGVQPTSGENLKRLLQALDEFEAVAPGIFGVETAGVRQRIIVDGSNAASVQCLAQLVEVGDGERGMRFLGRAKFAFNADMKLLASAPEPT